MGLNVGLTVTIFISVNVVIILLFLMYFLMKNIKAEGGFKLPGENYGKSISRVFLNPFNPLNWIRFFWNFRKIFNPFNWFKIFTFFY